MHCTLVISKKSSQQQFIWEKKGSTTPVLKPRWLRDLVRFLPLKSQFVLSGNVRDLQAFEINPGLMAPLPLIACLNSELRQAGYKDVWQFLPTAGFSAVGDGNTGQLEETLNKLGIVNNSGAIDALGGALMRFAQAAGNPSALIVDFASRLLVRPDVLSIAEQALFTNAQIACHLAQSRPAGVQRKPFFNTIIWIVERESDLPDWFTIDNPRLRSISIAVPDANIRKSLARPLLQALPDYRDSKEDVIQKAADTFVSLTDGLRVYDMSAIAQLGRNEGVCVAEIADAIRRYKVGVTEDPWQQIDRSKVIGGFDFITSRVKGQDHAVTHMLDIIKRAVVGFGRSQTNGRPRGVAFLAGPTGTGKTELAKTVTSLLFGDEAAYIRFDMSEFSSEHADQRLIGAPPGYVGYDAGGELTNAIREKPFSVVLFDEIEKAHPRILDKFLQILDDGVLTSGRGDRVYFSEAIILFTSNLGIYRSDGNGNRVQNVSDKDKHEVVISKVRAEIENHFKLSLNRPEILNRIGENVIVFDFIRPEIADAIFEGMVASVLNSTKSLGFSISISAEPMSLLKKLCLDDLSNGGRGVRNMVEAHLTNPLARALFETGAVSGIFEITDLTFGAITAISLKALEH